MSRTLEDLADNPRFMEAMRSGAALTGAQIADLLERAYESGYQAGIEQAADKIADLMARRSA